MSRKEVILLLSDDSDNPGNSANESDAIIPVANYSARKEVILLLSDNLADNPANAANEIDAVIRIIPVFNDSALFWPNVTDHFVAEKSNLLSFTIRGAPVALR